MTTYSAIPGRASDAGPDERPVAVEQDDCDASYDAAVDDDLEAE